MSIKGPQSRPSTASKPSSITPSKPRQPLPPQKQPLPPQKKSNAQAGRQYVPRVVKATNKTPKTFLDQAQQLALISSINVEEESTISKKLVRMGRVDEDGKERERKSKVREEEKREYLESVKDSLRKKRKRKEKVTEEREAREESAKEKKRVSFA